MFFIGFMSGACLVASRELRYGKYTLPKWLRLLLFAYINYGDVIELYKNEGRKVFPDEYKFTLHSIIYASALWVGLIITHVLYFTGVEIMGELVVSVYVIFLVIPWFIVSSVYGIKYYIRKRTQKITVERQLEALAELGIKSIHDTFIKWLCENWSRGLAEDMPWSVILTALGGERECENGFEPLSSDIFSIYIEGENLNDIYIKILETLSYYSKGEFNVGKITSTISSDANKTTILFVYMENQYDWQLRLDGDNFDLTLMDKINALIKENGMPKLFYTCLRNQYLYVLYTSEEVVKKLHSLDNWPSYMKFTSSI